MLLTWMGIHHKGCLHPQKTGGVQKSADPVMVLLAREQELRKNEQELRKNDQEQKKSDTAMLHIAMAHIIEINQKLMNKTV